MKPICIIDRFEGNFAVVEYGNTTFNIPRALLAQNCSEGDVISVSIIKDEEETKKRRDYVATLSKTLFK